MDSELLTTGEVAKLCGVTPDAVLKWIKSGKLPATRTPGGHFRVSRQSCVAQGLCDSGSEQTRASAVAVAPDSPAGPARCWEYFGHHGTPREECLNCVVYVARAQNCFALAKLGKEAGHRLNFCGTECSECAFYRAFRGLAMPTLVVTRDEALRRRLTKQADSDKITLRFAGSGYECATVVAKFRPALVVMDSDLPEVREGQLPEAVMGDQRMPGTAVFVALREGHEISAGRFEGRTIAAPFTAQTLEALAVSARETRRAPRDVA